MANLLELTKACIEYLSTRDARNPIHYVSNTDDPRFQAWLAAIRDERTGLKYEGKYVKCFFDNLGREPEVLTEQETVGCILFCTRGLVNADQLDHIATLGSGELLGYLKQWVRLHEE